MLDRFDPRVVPEPALRFVRACRARADVHLAGGAALSGAHLAHRLSGDLDLLRSFPIAPLPIMLAPLTVDELREYRDALAGRFRALALRT